MDNKISLVILVYVIGFCLTLAYGIWFDLWLKKEESEKGVDYIWNKEKEEAENDSNKIHYTLITMSVFNAIFWFLYVPTLVITYLFRKKFMDYMQNKHDRLK